MELRVLKYFLTVAQEGSITRAAELLHVTQPTLSRQLMQLEEELGVRLFRRGRHSVTLTDAGMLMKRRAQEIVTLADRAKAECVQQDAQLAGEITVGCGETMSMSALAECMAVFRKQHPLVRFNVYSGVADDVKDRIEKGLIDIGLLVEPVDVERYEVLRLPGQERWGVLVREDSPLAEKASVGPADFIGTPVLIGRREDVQNQLAGWFGEWFDQLDIAAHYTLILNAAAMVAQGMGAAFCLEHRAVFREGLRFIPLAPVLENGTMLVWKKYASFSPATHRFLEFLRNTFEA
ncbi:MAG: LysR family transcriptional regulator [Hominenteromicrobium sp.]